MRTAKAGNKGGQKRVKIMGEGVEKKGTGREKCLEKKRGMGSRKGKLKAVRTIGIVKCWVRPGKKMRWALKGKRWTSKTNGAKKTTCGTGHQIGGRSNVQEGVGSGVWGLVCWSWVWLFVGWVVVGVWVACGVFGGWVLPGLRIRLQQRGKEK